MRREDFLYEHVNHMKLKPTMTINQLIQEFSKSGCFGAGRVATACDIFERMVRDEQCAVFLTVAGAVVPAGLRSVIADVIRKKFVDVVVSTGANLVHDLIEAFGGHHYKGHWLVDDFLLYKYHLYRIYDLFVPEEDYVKMDEQLASIYDEIAKENKGQSIASHEFVWEIGKRIKDPNSITRAAYEANVPIFLPAVRDSEFGYIYLLHSQRAKQNELLKLNAFEEVKKLTEIMRNSDRIGMVVIGGGVPRNTVQHAAATTRKGMDYAIIITMDRPETGGLSGSTLEETISWGKVKGSAAKVMVIGDALIVFPLIVACTLERIGENFVRTHAIQKDKG